MNFYEIDHYYLTHCTRIIEAENIQEAIEIAQEIPLQDKHYADLITNLEPWPAADKIRQL